MTPAYKRQSDAPMSAHEILRAQALTQRLTAALAASDKKLEGERMLLIMLPRWIWSQQEYPHARQSIRHYLANPPKILGEAA